jgi:hypothetical protein
MNSNEFIPRILNAVRSDITNGRTLADVIREISESLWQTNGKMPIHTGAAFIGNALYSLYSNQLITLSSAGNAQVEQEIRDFKGNSQAEALNFGIGYKFADIFRGHESEVVLKLSRHFEALQLMLGLSITDMVKESGSYVARVAPLFREPDRKLGSDVFVLMPFEESMKPIYDDHIKATCKKIGFSCRRADDLFTATNVMSDVWSSIYYSKIIIADCTGRNPNVFYEIGIAHTLGRPVVLITQREEDVPFDIRHIRYLKYSFTPRGMKEFELALKATLEEIGNH